MTALQVRLGEALVLDAGLSLADLDRALALAKERRIRLGSALIELGLFSADDIAMALAQQHGVASVRDKHLGAIDPKTRAMISPATEQRLGAVAVALAQGEPPRLVVAMRDPRDAAAIAAIEAETKLLVMPAAASASRLDALIRDAGAASLLDLIRSSVPPRPAGVLLTGASPLLDLDELPQRTTPWNAAARAAALEARRARITGSPAPTAKGTQPEPIAAPARETLAPPVPAASGTTVPRKSPPRWRTLAIVTAIIVVAELGYATYRRLSSSEPEPPAAPSTTR